MPPKLEPRGPKASPSRGGNRPPSMNAPSSSPGKKKKMLATSTKTKSVVKGMALGRNASTRAPDPSDTPPSQTSSQPGSPGPTRTPPSAPPTASATVSPQQSSAQEPPSPMAPPPKTKSAAPKTLRDVASFYDFPLDAVRDANPSLSHLSDDDKIPKGTKLQLPKKSLKLNSQASLTKSNDGSPTVASPPRAAASGKGAGDALAAVRAKAEAARREKEAKERAKEEAEAAALAEEQEAASQADFAKRPQTSTLSKSSTLAGSTSSGLGASTKKKKGAPKSLLEVAEMYDFPYEDVVEANPTLRHLGPNDRIPVGTKLQLPKRKPTLAQLQAQVMVMESQKRQLVVQEYDRESDNFFFLLRLEKKKLLKDYEEQEQLMKKHSRGSAELMRERLQDMAQYAVDEGDRRRLILTRRISSDEQITRLKVIRERADGMEDLKKEEDFYLGVIQKLYRDIAALVKNHDETARPKAEAEEATERKFLLSRHAVEMDHLTFIRDELTPAEAADREKLAKFEVEEKKRVEAYLVLKNKLDAECEAAAAVIEREEVDGRAEVVAAHDARMRHIDGLYADRREIEKEHFAAQKESAEAEETERRELADLMAEWTRRMRNAANYAQVIMNDEAAAQSKLSAEEFAARGKIQSAMMRHREGVNKLLGEQDKMRDAENAGRLQVFEAWRRGQVAIAEVLVPDRLNMLVAQVRPTVEADEANEREALQIVAVDLHALARQHDNERRSLETEAFQSLPHHHTHLLEQFVEEYAAAAKRVSEDEGAARRQGAAEDEETAFVALSRGVAELNIAARKFIAEGNRLEAEEAERRDLEIADVEDEKRALLYKWNARRIDMIEKGMTEEEFMIAEEEHARQEISQENDRERFRIGGLAHESKEFIRELLAVRDEFIWQEHLSRKELLKSEESDRGKLRVMADDGHRAAWNATADRIFSEKSTKLIKEEEPARASIIAEQNEVRGELAKQKASDKARALAEEQARHAREALLRALREKQRKERLLLEKSNESERDTIEFEWKATSAALFRDVGVIEGEVVWRRDIEESDEPQAFDEFTEAFYEGIRQIERDYIAAGEAEAREELVADEEEGFQEWRRVRLEEHYEIWLLEEAERIRLFEQNRDQCIADEETERGELIAELQEAVAELVNADKAGQKEARRLERERIEAYERAVKEWRERMWFDRKTMGDEEAQLREEELIEPEMKQWQKLTNTEARMRRRVMMEAEQRRRDEEEAERQRRAEEEARLEAERLERQRALELELAAQRERERKALEKKHTAHRDRFALREDNHRGKLVKQYDEWLEKTTAELAESKQAAHNAAVDRETNEMARDLFGEEQRERGTILDEADESNIQFRERLEAEYLEAVREAKERKAQSLWTTLVSVDNIEAAMELEDDEIAGRQELVYEWYTAFRSWIDAISIEERLIEERGRRMTTQALLAVNEEEFEERGLVLLLEGLLRVQLEAEFDRIILLDWEERCTDAIHAFAIDSIDAFLTFGIAAVRDTSFAFKEPRCYRRSTFEDIEEDTGDLPVLAESSLALTPRPPEAQLVTIASTPGRLRQRLDSYRLDGGAGTPRHLLSRVRRFDEECRSNASTPFSSPGNYRSRNTGFTGHGSPGDRLPQLTASARSTPAIMPPQQKKSNAPSQASPQLPSVLPKPPGTAPSAARPGLHSSQQQQSLLAIISKTPNNTRRAAARPDTTSTPLRSPGFDL